VAKKWLDGAKIIGAKSMRVNSGGPRIVPSPIAAAGDYPKNDELAKYLTHCIESFKEMADYGGKVGVKVTLENHWGLTANPINIRIIVDSVGSPFCEASPDFCNWEHEYLMYNRLKDLAPYAQRTFMQVLEPLERQRCPPLVKIMNDVGFKGTFKLEHEDGPGTAWRARSTSIRKCCRAVDRRVYRTTPRLASFAGSLCGHSPRALLCECRECPPTGCSPVRSALPTSIVPESRSRPMARRNDGR
jgi:hypothetical protein